MSFFLAHNFFCLFIFFFVYTNLNLNLNLNKIFIKNNIKLNRDLVSKNNSLQLLSFFFVIFFLNFIYAQSLLITETTFFCKNFFFTNFSLNLFFFTIFLNLIIIYFIKNFFFNKIIFLSQDFIYTLATLMLLAPYLYFTNNFISLFLFLELLNILFFLSFVTYYSATNLNSLQVNFNFFIKIIFYQFWTSFFSSILLFWAILYIFYTFGTTEFFYINFLLDINLTNELNLTIMLSIFIFGFFLKIGIAPLHFLKLELYKNLAFFTIFLFTCFYFIYFFLFIAILTLIKLPQLLYYTYYFIFLFIILLFVSFIFFFIDLYFFKTFFAYSTVLNFINLLFILNSNFINV